MNIIFLILFVNVISDQVQNTDVYHLFKYKRGLRSFMNFQCRPGDKFKYGCHLCTCAENTRREVECRRMTRCYRLYKCTPFTSFVSGCLPCTCQMNGWPFCKVKCWKKQIKKVKNQQIPNTSMQTTSKVNSSHLYLAFS